MEFGFPGSSVLLFIATTTKTTEKIRVASTFSLCILRCNTLTNIH